jgi:hypothetical protein
LTPAATVLAFLIPVFTLLIHRGNLKNNRANTMRDFYRAIGEKEKKEMRGKLRKVYDDIKGDTTPSKWASAREKMEKDKGLDEVCSNILADLHVWCMLSQMKMLPVKMFRQSSNDMVFINMFEMLVPHIEMRREKQKSDNEPVNYGSSLEHFYYKLYNTGIFGNYYKRTPVVISAECRSENKKTEWLIARLRRKYPDMGRGFDKE